MTTLATYRRSARGGRAACGTTEVGGGSVWVTDCQFCTIDLMATPPPLLGHANLLRRLELEADSDVLTHALLFVGPDGVGKTTTAFTLADHLLDGSSWPGGVATHPDLWIEDSDSENISINRVRAGGDQGPTLQDFLSLRTYAGGRRVAIIARAERLGEAAADCLLKTIEEPPPRSVLVLCAAHPERLPSTVLSRCEAVVFGPVAAPEISNWLHTVHGVDEQRAAFAAALAAGRPGRSLRLATDARALDGELDALDQFLATGGSGAAGALRTAAAVAPQAGAEGRERALVTLAVWAAFVRDAVCYASAVPELAIWSSRRAALERWAEALPSWRIVAILDRILEASEAVAMYAQPRLAFEALLLDIFAGADRPPSVDESLRGARTASADDGAAGRARRKPSARRV